VRCWQNGRVLRKFSDLSRRNIVVAVALCGLLSACSSDTSSLCSSNVSVSDYVTGFSQGLDNFSEDRYAQLRADSNTAYERTVNAVTEDVITVEAAALAKKISRFISVMDSVDWDVNSALNLSEAVAAALALGSQGTLREANSVEGQLLSSCGMPSTLATPSEAEVTLPMNPIPSPTATDPTTNTLNDSSELRIIGMMVATQFGLTVSDSEATCLGTALSDVYDVSGPDSNSAQYQGQFQRAFDSCGIEFTVPNE